MAKNGPAELLSTWGKRLFGKNEKAYTFFKKMMYAVIGFFRRFRVLTPGDIAYRIFKPDSTLYTGYITSVHSQGISGFVFTAGQEPVKVELLIDGRVINRSWSIQKIFYPSLYAGSSSGFYFPMNRVWRHLSRGQKLEILADKRALRYKAGPGRGKPIPNRGARRLADKNILDLIGSGKLITKFGRIQEPANENDQWAAKVFGNYSKLNSIFKKVTGKSLFVFYGVLLGFAREGGILAHDMDLDLAYFSELTDPEAVRREFKDIAEKLIDSGITVVPQTYKLQFGGKGISVTPCWISSEGFSCTFGYVGGTTSVRRSDILPLKRAKHKEYDLLLPNDPVAVARYLYGSGWEYPDPGWKWLPEYKNRPQILVGRLKEKDLRDLNRRIEARRNAGGAKN
jgi:hypothetical protein